MKLLTKIVFLVCLFFTGTPVHALEIIYPEDGSLVENSNFLIVKGGDTPSLDGIVVEINGLKSGLLDISSPQYKAVFQDFLILEPEYSSGENMIRLEGYANGKAVRETAAKIYYQTDPYTIPPDGFRPFIMHTPQKETLCQPCHNMNPTEEQLKQSSATENPCGSCHSRMLDKKNVHGPAGVFRCTTCHDPASKPSRYQASGGNAESCNECHLDKVKEFKSSKFVHGPLQAGMCAVCHDSHASNYPAQLLRPINQVCLSCHESLNVKFHFTQGIGAGHPVSGVPDPLENNKELSCSSCHDPHGGATSRFFPEEYSSLMMMCQRCHKK